jgi:hypothetical protein
MRAMAKRVPLDEERMAVGDEAMTSVESIMKS